MRRAVFLSSPALWKQERPPDHPLRSERLQRTHELLDEYGAFHATNVTVLSPRPATDEQLGLFHAAEYIEATRRLSAGDQAVPAWRYGYGSEDNPVFPGMFEAAALRAGSSLEGAALVANGECDVAFSFAGGLHHAGRDFASGFCVFNDAAIAITWLVDKGFRVAYVDVDVHHGDGVQWAFYDAESVLTISLHQSGRTLFPGTGFVDEAGRGAGEGYSVNVPLAPYTDDAVYLWAFDQVVPPLLKRFAPDVVVTQLGVDTHYRDPLAGFMLTTNGQLGIFERLNVLAPRWLALGGGGYDLTVVPRAWTLAFGVMSGQSFPDALPDAYRAKYGDSWLRDREQPPLSQRDREFARRTAEAIVAEIRRRHDLA